MSASHTPKPANSFFGHSSWVRGLGVAMRTAQPLAPHLATRLALRLFFTPLPLKFAARRHALPAPWQMERWPFEHASLAVYRRSDIAANAPLALLLHGWGGNALQMRPAADALAAAGLNPVLMEPPAHGRSEGWRSTLPQFVRALWMASARLGPLHAVVAHSMGAVAASHAAAKGLPVQRLVLLAPAPSPSAVLQMFARSFGLGEAMPARMRTLIERREGLSLNEFEPAWLGGRVAQPTLLVHDTGDRASPLAVGRDLAHALGARMVATDGLGHRRLLADAAVLEALTSHLTDQRRPNGSGM